MRIRFELNPRPGKTLYRRKPVCGKGIDVGV